MLKSYLSAFQIGIIAGMRAMTAPALVSHKLAYTGTNPIPDSKLHFLAKSQTATITKVLAAGELIGDKLPNAPSRIAPAALPGRIISGAVSGGALSKAAGHDVTYGAVAGALGAAAGSFAFYYLRHWLTTEKGLPDPAVAVAEDLLAIGAGLWTIDQVELKPAVD